MTTFGRPPFGFNIFGLASANTGIGFATRQTARVLQARGYPVCIIDIDAGHGRSGKNMECQDLFLAPECPPPYAVNLLIEGAPDIASFVLKPNRLIAEGHLNVGFIWWELPEWPERFRVAAEFFDVLMAGSSFVQSAMTNQIPRTPVLLAEHPLRLPESVSSNRARFDLPVDAFVVGMAFDPHSDPARKNPFAALKAFQLAFPGHPGCHLVIKMSSTKGVDAKMRALLDELQSQAADDPRVHVIEEMLTYKELMQLYASYDVFVSLHRSEGLGLAPLEAMFLGKPVVATGWSGNMSYMSPTNSCPVAHDLVAVDDDSAIYGPSALGIQGHWASPLAEHAAAWLSLLHENVDFRKRIGSAAHEDSRKYLARAERADFAAELEAIWSAIEAYPLRDRTSLKKRIVQAMHNDDLRMMKWPQRQFAKLQYPVRVFVERQLLWRFKPRTSV